MLSKSFLDDDIVDFVEEYAETWYGDYFPFSHYLPSSSSSGGFEDIADSVSGGELW